jgi:hypothetical protein
MTVFLTAVAHPYLSAYGALLPTLSEIFQVYHTQKPDRTLLPLPTFGKGGFKTKQEGCSCWNTPLVLYCSSGARILKAPGTFPLPMNPPNKEYPIS